MTSEEFQTLFAQYRELKQTLEAELVKLAGQTEQWLPMDIAPRDGTLLILSGKTLDGKGMGIMLGRYSEEACGWIGKVTRKPVSPLYWLPAPTAPNPDLLPY